jgi:hypothetical protein
VRLASDENNMSVPVYVALPVKIVSQLDLFAASPAKARLLELVVWHAGGMPEDDCPTVSDSRGPSRVRSGAQHGGSGRLGSNRAVRRP